MMVANFVLICLHLALMLCCRVAAVTYGVPRMLTKSRAYFVDAGERLRLDCQFSMETFNLFDNPIVWIKTQLNERTQMNMMGNLVEPFESTGRFRVTFEATRPTFTLGLLIEDVTQGDSGNYTCEVEGPLNAVLGHMTHYVYVRAPIDRVYIVVGDTASADTVDSRRGSVFVANRPTATRCVADGGYPAPDVTVHVAGRDATNAFPFSQTLQFAAAATADDDDDVGGVGDGRRPRPLRALRYVTERRHDGLRMPASDDGKTIDCIATVAGLTANKSSSQIIVHYPPTIYCRPSYAFLGDMSVHVWCEVRAKPQVTALFWIIDVNGTTVSHGEVINEYWTLVMDRSDGALETQLFLKQTKPESFRLYTLVAENIVGARTLQVALIQKYRAGSGTADPALVKERSAALRRVVSSRPIVDSSVIALSNAVYMSPGFRACVVAILASFPFVLLIRV